MQTNNAVRFPLATSTWDEKEIAAIQSVIARDMYTMGTSVAQFEQDFARFVGAKHAVMVNSGSSANLLAIAALFYTKTPYLKKGDEVIVPAVSWSTTFYPLYQYGLKLKFVDIDLETLNMDLNALESAITDKTRMIFAVNLLGNPNDFNRIKKIIGSRNILLLEDNCESLGAELGGRQAGTFGLMGTYSTFFSHHMATMEGGLVATDDEELYHVLLCLRSHGWTRHLPKENKITPKSDDWFVESFRFILPGYNLRPVEMSGAIGIEQLKKLPGFLAMRRKNAEQFYRLFKDNKRFIIQKETGSSSWFGFSLVLRPESPLKRADVVKHLTAAGIECRPIVTGNFTKNEVMRFFDHELHGTMKNAEIADQNGLFVGNHQIDLGKELDYLAETIAKLG
ncbi:MAG: DegT/DnrJ/EryC1/StrS family aminotransferase [Spirochaetota bacterium]